MKIPPPLPDFDGAAPRVHDAVIACEGGTYSLFSIGRGLSVRRSLDF